MEEITMQDIIEIAISKAVNFGSEYVSRLRSEITAIEKQAASQYWVDLYNNKTKFDHNKNGLVIAFLLGITDIDPIINNIDHKIEQQPDMPDIDCDFLPMARDPIKQYAAEKYGQDYVCSVGSWVTYKPKSALRDAASALGYKVSDVERLTSVLPEEFDEMTMIDALREFKEFREYASANPKVIRIAYNMVGRIKTQGRHAGGLIISSVPVHEHIPMAISGSSENKQWISTWTEGHNTQLSKFGFVKFDILGLITLSWIWHAGNLIRQNRGIDISWVDIDPDDDRAGWEIHEDGTRHKIRLNDPKALGMANDLKVQSIFQFDTPLAMSILSRGGVKSIKDLLIYTSLGRPGPLPMVDVYIKRRDGEETWDDEHPDIVRILKDTYSIICFQEQLASLWVEVAGFTIPEAEAARKAVAKKWVDKLKPIGKKWLDGASRKLGQTKAKEWWDRMVTFGRYAFNLAHGTAYTVISHRCLYLKAHYPHEWWAAVMSHCKQDKLIRYMAVAKSEGVEFGRLTCDNLNVDFTVDGDIVVVGLNSIKGIGINIAVKFCKSSIYESVDDFVKRNGKSKVIMERLIKLGAFDHLYERRRRALWVWYLYKYGSGSEAIEIRKKIRDHFTWTDKQIETERSRLMDEYKFQYPNKNIPKRIIEWKPKKHIATFGEVCELFSDEYTIHEILKFEKEYLGYYWTSPMIQFYTIGSSTIMEARDGDSGLLEVIVEKVEKKETKRGKPYYRLLVADGIELAYLTLWPNDIEFSGSDLIEVGAGLRMQVEWNDRYRTFNLEPGTQMLPLAKVKIDAPED